MEILLILAAAAVVWFFVSGNYKTKFQDPQTLRPYELEQSIIELKLKILAMRTRAIGPEYERLTNRMASLMGQVLARHLHFVLDFEASDSVPFGFFEQRRREDATGMQYTIYSIPRDIDPSRFSPSLLIYACFFLWYGGAARSIGLIESDSDLMMRILKFLVDDRNYAPALFMTGLVLKYGQNPNSECSPGEARQFLERAREAGIGSAAIELNNIAKYSGLVSSESA